MSAQLWVVRAGREAAYVDEWRRDGVVAVNFDTFEAGDLIVVGDAGLLEKVTSPAERTYASQIIAFAFKVDIGDLVVVPQLPKRRTYLVGEITSGYTHLSAHPLSGPHQRTVRWRGEFDRDALSREAVNTLGAIQTIFRPTKVEAELRNLLTDLRPWAGTAAPTPRRTDDDLSDPSRPSLPPSALASAPRSDQVPPATSATLVSQPAEVPLQVDVRLSGLGRATITCDHPALVMQQVHGTSTRRATGVPSPACKS